MQWQLGRGQEWPLAAGYQLLAADCLFASHWLLAAAGYSLFAAGRWPPAADCSFASRWWLAARKVSHGGSPRVFHTSYLQASKEVALTIGWRSRVTTDGGAVGGGAGSWAGLSWAGPGFDWVTRSARFYVWIETCVASPHGLLGEGPPVMN